MRFSEKINKIIEWFEFTKEELGDKKVADVICSEKGINMMLNNAKYIRDALVDNNFKRPEPKTHQ